MTRCRPVRLAVALCLPLVPASLGSTAFASVAGPATVQLDGAAPALHGASPAWTRGRARSLAIRTPAGTNVGDVMLAAVSVRAGRADRITPPPGWALLQRNQTRRGGRLTQLLYLRVARAGEPSSHRWRFALPVGAAGGILGYGGIDATNPVDAQGGRTALPSRRRARGRASSRRIPAPSLTTSVAGALVVGFFGRAGATTTTPPGGAVERYDVASRGRRGRVTSAAADRLEPKPGRTGSWVARSTPQQASRAAIAQLVALRPAVALPSALEAPAPAPAEDVAPPLPPPVLPLPIPLPLPIDVTPPETTISSGPSGTTTARSASFAFSSSEAESGSTFECRLDGGSWAACSSPKAYSRLSDGSHTFDVRATDAAGNVDASPASRTWTVNTAPPPDTTPPETTITGGPSGATSSTSASFSFTSSEAGSTFECQLDGGSWGTCSSPKVHSGLADGSRTFRVRSTDAAGNTDASPASRTWTVGTTPPQAGTFYVATTGSDSNSGSESGPWRTVQKALTTLQPGQRALVRAGTYVQALRLTRACTASANCSIEAYPGEQPVLDGRGSNALWVESQAGYWRFKGLTFTGFDGVSGGNVDIYGHHLLFVENVSRDSNNHGFYLDEASRDNTFERNLIRNNGGCHGVQQQHGFYLQGARHLVVNNVIHDHPCGFGIQVYDQNDDSIIYHNTVTHSGHAGIVIGGSGGVRGVVVRNNILAFNAKNGLDYDSSCPISATADYNVFWQNGSSGNAHIDAQSCSGVNLSGGNRLGADPRFADVAARNFHLLSGSDALDYGLPGLTTVDNDGESRPQGGRADAGAYEDG